MFWADLLLKDRKGPERINDAWTPSGIVHMGGLKGPVIHDVLYKILKEKGIKAKYTFGFDDMDAIDGLPKELLKTHEKYMGIPIANAPSPDGEGSFGDYYGRQMTDMFKKLNIEAEVYLASDYYRKGVSFCISNFSEEGAYLSTHILAYFAHCESPSFSISYFIFGI